VETATIDIVETSMTISQPSFVSDSLDILAQNFFQRSAGKWRSQRRYYTLDSDQVQEVVSLLTVEYLILGASALENLAKLHGLTQPLHCGAYTTWESHYAGPTDRPSKGSTIFGVGQGILYRDRGFATTKPVTASFLFRDPDTMQLKTSYNDSQFVEEIKLIGHDFRTRQTIISKAGKEQMIGQYLERRIE
jgi:hypothetical protein